MKLRLGCHNQEIVPLVCPPGVPQEMCSGPLALSGLLWINMRVLISTSWPNLNGKRNGQSSGIVNPCPWACVAPALSLQPPLQQKLWALGLASMPLWRILGTGFK